MVFDFYPFPSNEKENKNRFLCKKYILVICAHEFNGPYLHNCFLSWIININWIEVIYIFGRQSPLTFRNKRHQIERYRFPHIV